MPSTFRIPKADLDGPLGRLMAAYTRRKFGQVPDGAYVGWHHRKLMSAVFAFERRVATWDALDPHLKTYAQLASAAMIGCSWCVDFGYYLAHQEGLDEAKVSQVPQWRECDLFDEPERAVLAYAEAMTAQPPEVTDAMVADLIERLG